MKQNIKVAVDAVVFGYDQQELKVLLIQQKYGTTKSQWGLVGGLVKEEETLQQAVKRELKEETNIKLTHLEQLYTFGDKVNRDHRGRVISVAYFALVNSLNFKIKADSDAEEVAWHSIDELPKLAFDHKDIIQKAIERLRNKLRYQPVGFDLLPEQFLFSDLENLYASLLQEPIDRRNFRKKIIALGLVEATNDWQKPSTGRPAQLYKFNKEQYDYLIAEQIAPNMTFV